MIWDDPIIGELVRTYFGIGIVLVVVGGSVGASAMGVSPTLFSLGFVGLLAVMVIGWFRSKPIIDDPQRILAWIGAADPLGDANFRWFAAMLLSGPFLFGWLIGGALKGALTAGRD